MLNEHIDDIEYLYRRIPLNPSHWADTRPSSAAFKDEKGLSVDREGGRTKQEVVTNFTSKHQLKAVVRVSAKYCRGLPTTPKYLPYPPEIENVFHAEVHESEIIVEITKSKARQLAKEAEKCWISE